MIVTATADQVAQLPDGRIVIAKPGEQCGEAGCAALPWCACPSSAADVTGRCQTCRAEEPGHEWHLGYNRENCPDCRTGRPLFDLKVECGGKCEGSGVVSDWEGSAIECAKCDGYGFVTHAGLYVPGPLAVIYPGDDNPDEASYHGPAHIEYFDITLPPAARPGWYAVIAERRKT